MNQTDCIRVYREYCEANGWKCEPVPMALRAVAEAAVDDCAAYLDGLAQTFDRQSADPTLSYMDRDGLQMQAAAFRDGAKAIRSRSSAAGREGRL